VSFIDIELTKDHSESTQTRKGGVEKLVNHKTQSLTVKQSTKMDVLLLGYLDNPKIKCMKQLFNKTANTEVVSLAVKKTQGIQRFKLPFKNLSAYLDSDIEFAFIRTQGSCSEEGFVDPIDSLSFYCQPNQLKISAEQVAILTV